MFPFLIYRCYIFIEEITALKERKDVGDVSSVTYFKYTET